MRVFHFPYLSTPSGALTKLPVGGVLSYVLLVNRECRRLEKKILRWRGSGIACLVIGYEEEN